MKYIIAIFILFVFGTTISFSQEVQLRPSIQLKKTVKKKFDFSLTYEARIHKNISEYNSSLISLDGTYSVLKWLKIGVDYRIRFNVNNQLPTHSFGISLSADYTIKKVKFSLRTAYQRSQTYFVTDDISGIPSMNAWRNRLLAEFDLPKKFTYSLGIEPLLTFSPYEIQLRRIRISNSLKYDFKKRHSIALVYYLQPMFRGTDYQNLLHILKVIYSFDIPKFKNKNKE